MGCYFRPDFPKHLALVNETGVYWINEDLKKSGYFQNKNDYLAHVNYVAFKISKKVAVKLNKLLTTV